MEDHNDFVTKLKYYGVGRRSLDDNFFEKDNPLPKITIFDLEEEDLSHEVFISTCPVPSCKFTSDSLLEFENHYNSSHRYSCNECKKTLPSPHLLDLHIQEKHDSFFAVLSEKKASYCCYIEDCKDKFWSADDRQTHCVTIHKLPKNFRFELKNSKLNKKKSKKDKCTKTLSMEVDDNVADAEGNKNKEFKNFSFSHNKQKTFNKYTGKKFIEDNKNKISNVNIDEIMIDIKESLPS